MRPLAVTYPTVAIISNGELPQFRIPSAVCCDCLNLVSCQSTPQNGPLLSRRKVGSWDPDLTSLNVLCRGTYIVSFRPLWISILRMLKFDLFDGSIPFRLLIVVVACGGLITLQAHPQAVHRVRKPNCEVA